MTVSRRKWHELSAIYLAPAHSSLHNHRTGVNSIWENSFQYSWQEHMQLSFENDFQNSIGSQLSAVLWHWPSDSAVRVGGIIAEAHHSDCLLRSRILFYLWKGQLGVSIERQPIFKRKNITKKQPHLLMGTENRTHRPMVWKEQIPGLGSPLTFGWSSSQVKQVTILG